jgi:tetratricopeptide (TPR) repeat protein
MEWMNALAGGTICEEREALEEAVAREKTPGEATLFLGAVRALCENDRRYLDDAVKAVRGNVSHDRVTLVSGAFIFNIGLTVANRQFIEEGARGLREAVLANPDKRYLDVAATHLEKDSLYREEALRLYERILASCPADAGALVGRGGIRENRAVEMLDQAEEDFEAALRSDPTCASAHYEMGNLLAVRGDYLQAIPRFRAALQYAYWVPHAAKAGIAYCLHRLGRHQEAAQAARESLSLIPDYDYARTLLAEIETTLGRKKGQERMPST